MMIFSQMGVRDPISKVLPVSTIPNAPILTEVVLRLED
jgi:hypothetical protein